MRDSDVVPAALLIMIIGLMLALALALAPAASAFYDGLRLFEHLPK